MLSLTSRSVTNVVPVCQQIKSWFSRQPKPDDAVTTSRFVAAIVKKVDKEKKQASRTRTRQAGEIFMSTVYGEENSSYKKEVRRLVNEGSCPDETKQERSSRQMKAYRSVMEKAWEAAPSEVKEQYVEKARIEKEEREKEKKDEEENDAEQDSYSPREYQQYVGCLIRLLRLTIL